MKTDLETIAEMLVRQKIEFKTDGGVSLSFRGIELIFDAIGRLVDAGSIYAGRD